MGALTDSLAKMNTNISNTDKNWVIFVQDYIVPIKENAFSLTITPEIIDRYHYKFEHLLRENNCPTSIMWIARLINELTMYEDFAVKPSILIPDITFINTLYRKYRTSKNLS